MKAEYLPRVIEELINKARVIFCPLDELPQTIASGVDYLFIDDAHLIPEPETYQALKLYPKRVIMAGNYIPPNKQE